jgi:hypothetical protein
LTPLFQGTVTVFEYAGIPVIVAFAMNDVAAAGDGFASPPWIGSRRA